MEDRLRDPFWKHMRQFILSLQFLTFDGNYFYGTSMPILIRWLNTTRADGKSRYYFVRWNDGEHCIRLIERLREAFTNAQSSSTFIVEFDVTDMNAEDMQPPEPFLLRNEMNERLALGRYRYGTENNLILRRFPALPTAIGDDWMKPVLEKARKLMCGPMNKARDLGMDENGDLEEGPLNEIKLALEWPYSPFS